MIQSYRLEFQCSHLRTPERHQSPVCAKIKEKNKNKKPAFEFDFKIQVQIQIHKSTYRNPTPPPPLRFSPLIFFFHYPWFGQNLPVRSSTIPTIDYLIKQAIAPLASSCAFLKPVVSPFSPKSFIPLYNPPPLDPRKSTYLSSTCCQSTAGLRLMSS